MDKLIEWFRQDINRIVIAALIALLVLAMFSARQALADQIAVASEGGVTITLTNEPCALSQVANLPYRLTWQESGKSFEGCFGVRSEIGAVVAYFASDRTVALIPMQVFSRVNQM